MKKIQTLWNTFILAKRPRSDVYTSGFYIGKLCLYIWFFRKGLRSTSTSTCHWLHNVYYILQKFKNTLKQFSICNINCICCISQNVFVHLYFHWWWLWRFSHWNPFHYTFHWSYLTFIINLNGYCLRNPLPRECALCS